MVEPMDPIKELSCLHVHLTVDYSYQLIILFCKPMLSLIVKMAHDVMQVFNSFSYVHETAQTLFCAIYYTYTVATQLSKISNNYITTYVLAKNCFD